jgi:hypothetical protein
MTKLEKLHLWCNVEGYSSFLRNHGRGRQTLFIRNAGKNPDAAIVQQINGMGLAACAEELMPNPSLRVTEPSVRDELAKKLVL